MGEDIFAHSSILRAFEVANSDKSDCFDQQEFMEMISDPVLSEDLNDLGVRIDLADGIDMFAAFDKGQKGFVTLSEFVTGMQQLRDGVTSRQILTLYGAILRVGRMLVEMKDQQSPHT